MKNEVTINIEQFLKKCNSKTYFCPNKLLCLVRYFSERTSSFFAYSDSTSDFRFKKSCMSLTSVTRDSFC